MSRRVGGALGCAALLVVACGATSATSDSADDAGAPSVDTQAADAASSSSGAGSSAADATAADSSDRGDVDADTTPGPIQCGIQLPAGAAVPPPLPLYAGTCPAIAAYPAYTELGSRQFLVIRPSSAVANEKLPVVFMWHWLGGSPEDMVDKLQLVAATEAMRFVAVVPAPKDSETFRWPFTNALASSGRMQEEYTFFDDMLACVAASMPIDEGCVSSLGISAGALFTAQLVIGRGERLASFVSLSGGVGGLARSWSTPAHTPPGVVLWGGDDDEYPKPVPVMHFDQLSAKLETGMTQDHLGMIECVHNCGHTVPPLDLPPSGIRFEAFYDFVLRHPYGLPAGAVNYPTGLPSTFPAWCAIGPGTAIARDAACP